MEGSLFYWFAWMGWTITTFLLPKTKQRMFLSAIILILIISSRTTITIEDFSFNAALLIIALISYAYIGTGRFLSMCYSIVISVMISLGYLGLHYLVVFDPVAVFLDLHFFLSVPLALIVIFMVDELDIRISVLFSGLVHGEIAYVFLVKELSPDYVVGSLVFLDIIGLASVIVFLWWCYERFTNLMKQKVDRPISHVKENTPLR